MLCYRCGSYTPDGSRACTVCGQPFTSQRRNTRNVTATTAGPGRTMPPFLPGEVIGERYTIVGPIGPGTCGWVMRAQDQQNEADVAVKVIATNLLQTDDDRALFLKAVDQTREVDHDNVVSIVDAGRDGGFVYYVMSYLEGLTLRKIIDLRLEKGDAFTLDETIPLLEQIAAGLDALAEQGQHGALRPSNVLIMPELLKITGLPHHQGLPRRPFVELLGQFRALTYLAPEARPDDGKVDARADVFSLAVIVSEMLTGKPKKSDSEDWGQFESRLPRSIISALRGALVEAPASRFKSASLLSAAIVDGVLDPAAKCGEPARQASEDPHAAKHPREPPPPPSEALEGDDETPSGSTLLEISRETTDGRPIKLGAVSIDDGDRGPVASDGTCQDSPAPGGGAPEGAKRQPSALPRGLRPWQRNALLLLLLFALGLAISLGIQARKRMSMAARSASTPLQDQDNPRATAGNAQESSSERQSVRGASLSDTLVAIPAADASPKTSGAVAASMGSAGSEAAGHGAVRPSSGCPKGMIAIAAGDFELGSRAGDPLRGFGDVAARRMRLKAFCIDRYEHPGQQGKQPTVDVTWSRARRLCERQGKRLCTEAEWERVCRGPSGARFPFGNSYQEGVCNTGGGAGSRLAITGSFSRCVSGFGAVDMAGNAAEWTASRWSQEIPDKVVKGGAVDQSHYTARCAARVNEPASTHDRKIGFRCCIDLK